MPHIYILSLITGALGSVFGFFAKYLTKKLALAATFLTITLSLIVGFIAALNGIMTGLSYIMPDFLGDAFGLFMPSNTLVCITAIYSAQVAKWVFNKNTDIVNGQMRMFS